METFAIIPVKELARAKERLSPLLSQEERGGLVLSMLKDVVTAVKDTETISRTVVISLDAKVLEEASSLGVNVIKEEPPPRLNSAVRQAVNWCMREEASSALIIPVDIPLIVKEDVDRFVTVGERWGGGPSVVVSPSRNGNGTNALMLTPPSVIPTHYGPRSFQLHVEEALARGVTPRIYDLPTIALDIDSPRDLADFTNIEGMTNTHRFLNRVNVQGRLIVRPRQPTSWEAR